MARSMEVQELAMGCRHNWEWPRRCIVGGRKIDIQTCAKCGCTRESPIQFADSQKEEPAKPLDRNRFSMLPFNCSRGAKF